MITGTLNSSSTWNHIKFIVEAWSMDADYAEDPRYLLTPGSRTNFTLTFPSLKARPRWLLPPFTGPSWKLAVAFCVCLAPVRKQTSYPPSLLTPMIDHFDLIIGHDSIRNSRRTNTPQLIKSSRYISFPKSLFPKLTLGFAFNLLLQTIDLFILNQIGMDLLFLIIVAFLNQPISTISSIIKNFNINTPHNK